MLGKIYCDMINYTVIEQNISFKHWLSIELEKIEFKAHTHTYTQNKLKKKENRTGKHKTMLRMDRGRRERNLMKLKPPVINGDDAFAIRVSTCRPLRDTFSLKDVGCGWFVFLPPSNTDEWHRNSVDSHTIFIILSTLNRSQHFALMT